MSSESKPTKTRRKTRWPGFRWSLTADRMDKPGPSGKCIGERIAISDEDFPEWTCVDEFWLGGGDGAWPLIHVEAMNDRDWWIGIGDATFALDVWREPDGTIGVMVRDELAYGTGKVKVTYDRPVPTEAA